MSDTKQIKVKRLRRGYILETGGEEIAGATNFADLVTFLAEALGEELVGIETGDSSLWWDREIAEEERPTSEQMKDVREALKRIDEDRPTETEPDRPTPAPEATPSRPPDTPDPEAAAPAKREAPKLSEKKDDLPEMQQRVLDHLQLCALRHGERFQLGGGRLAEKAGVARGSLAWLLGELERKGYIIVESRGRGIDPFYVVPIPDDMKEAAA
ncbi:hypothetical protein [Oricola cellulosilytica]|uniref:Uncharacterized protein n=1 Tax=Oricola cellulosilytica TaxID=1429082 RepID=A0A4R0PCG3_9HYPH|nr:hypothetical protein [Oricola cellulosilytica]TCD15162.1 hypothetical protein E0D97_06330 [Oricola cellulosilytica]